MEERKLIAMQDDCAPDSYQYFDKDMVTNTGFSVVEFKGVSDMTMTEMGYEWVHEDNVLIWESDDPYYKLFKV